MHRDIPRIVVLGDGLLGSEIQKQTGWSVLSRRGDGFDITQPDSFTSFFVNIVDGLYACKKFDIIINCIANTATYSDNKEEHWKVNYKGAADLADHCNLWGIKLVHISTDYVYTDSVNEASEEDIPIHGDNWYSYTKMLADAYIELRSKDYLICRGTHKPKPFPYEEAWIDQIGNFDYVDVIASIIIQVVRSGECGIFNIGTEVKTMFELAHQTSRVGKSLRPQKAPGNVTMNLNKLNNVLKGVDK